MIHVFQHSIDDIQLPEKFTFPFHYTPHPLCIMAAEEVQQYLAQRKDWHEELKVGKMFGVLVVQTSDGQIGYLAAFSGNLAHSNHHLFFVSPVYDLLQPSGFFKIEETKISDLNKQIETIKGSSDYLSFKQTYITKSEDVKKSLCEAKSFLKVEKEKRNKLRFGLLTEEENLQLIKESQFQKAEYKRLENRLKIELAEIYEIVHSYDIRINALKEERKKRSEALQMKLFDQFRLLNAKGEERGLCEIFASTSLQVPPAGAGECAAPKLLQYAYQNHLHPIAMAEFWWGGSPQAEIRTQGCYYPACKGKCGPILGWMLQGLDVEKNPLEEKVEQTLEIIYEDDWLMAVNKPTGLLSTPGKEQTDSVYTRIHQMCPEMTGPLIVHRLDMATSGLLLIAKNKKVHELLQTMFSRREVKKTYIALLDGIVEPDEGVVDLPLFPDFLDRPRQRVHHEQGKEAVTLYKVLERKDGRTRIAFYPQTGRTHQLRVHAASAEGLNVPIVGDMLYGRKEKRLYLHAESLSFIHPIIGKPLHLECPADF